MELWLNSVLLLDYSFSKYQLFISQNQTDPVFLNELYTQKRVTDHETQKDTSNCLPSGQVGGKGRGW